MNTRIKCLIVVLAILVPDTNWLAAQGSARVVRRGLPFEQAIRPGESQLSVIESDPPPLYVLPGPGEGLLHWMCTQSDATILFDVISIERRLTDAHDWIVSNATATVVQVPEPSTGVAWLPSGQQFSFLLNGGDMIVNGTHVTAIAPDAKLLAVGKRYLAFVSLTADHDVILTRQWTYLVDGDGTLRRQLTRGSVANGIDDVEGRILNDVLAGLTCSHS